MTICAVGAIGTVGAVGAVDLIVAISALELSNSLIALLDEERLSLFPDTCVLAVWEL